MRSRFQPTNRNLVPHPVAFVDQLLSNVAQPDDGSAFVGVGESHHGPILDVDEEHVVLLVLPVEGSLEVGEIRVRPR